MISHLAYVSCDECQNPAEPLLGDAKEARLQARHEGFARVGNQDLCPNCRPDRPACPLCGEPARWYYDSRVYWHCLVPVKP